MKKNSGIYMIKNILNGKLYIGSTTDLSGRFYDHRCELRLNEHDSTHLQNAWNKYGESNFVFEVVEYIDFIDDKLLMKKLLEVREQYWMDQYPREQRYNIRTRAENNLGIKHTLEVKKKISENTKAGMSNLDINKRINMSRKGTKLGPVPEERKKKIALTSKIRMSKPEALQNLREKNLGENNPVYGKPAWNRGLKMRERKP
jgi:group I intron endonuclease